MALITGFLIAYVCFTLPFIVYGIRRALQKRAPLVAETKGTELEEIIKTAFLGKGIKATVHEMPKNATEAIVAKSKEILDYLDGFSRTHAQYLISIRDKAIENKTDMQALLQASHAVTKSILELKKPQTPEENVDSFVHSLEYARDKFATTPTQRRAVETIISQVKTSYGHKK